MKLKYLDIFRLTKTGQAVVMLVGQPETHLMDWQGCNFKRLALPLRLRRIFGNYEAAKKYKNQLEKTHWDQFENYARRHAGASFSGRGFANHDHWCPNCKRTRECTDLRCAEDFVSKCERCISAN